MSKIEAFTNFANCVKAGGHTWSGDVCVRCGAKKDGKTIPEILAEARGASMSMSNRDRVVASLCHTFPSSRDDLLTKVQGAYDAGMRAERDRIIDMMESFPETSSARLLIKRVMDGEG